MKILRYFSSCSFKTCGDRGPVVKSIVSLATLLVVDLLSLTVVIKSVAIIFFADKLCGAFAFAMQKLLTFLCPQLRRS